MMKTTQTLLATLALTAGLFATTGANASLTASDGGNTVFDSDLNIYWLADANLAATNSFGLARNTDLGAIPGVYGGSFIFDDGMMTMGGAMKWIAAMNAANYLGYNDWRLPTTLQPDASCGDQNVGWVIGSYGYNCTGSEMGNLFYTELGGAAASSILSTHNASLALFQNVQPYFYYSGTKYAPDPTYQAWVFDMYGGYQAPAPMGNYFYAFAVRSGQVAVVPVPAAVWLLGSGLLGLIGVARRRLVIR
jgi:hypothetical protein